MYSYCTSTNHLDLIIYFVRFNLIFLARAVAPLAIHFIHLHVTTGIIEN